MTELARLQLMEMNIALLLSRNEVVIKKSRPQAPDRAWGCQMRDCHGLRLCNDSRARNDTSLSF